MAFGDVAGSAFLEYLNAVSVPSSDHIAKPLVSCIVQLAGHNLRTVIGTESIFSASGTIYHEANVINVLFCDISEPFRARAELLTGAYWVPGGHRQELWLRSGRGLLKIRQRDRP